MNKTLQERVQISQASPSAGSSSDGRNPAADVFARVKGWLTGSLHSSKFVQHLMGLDQEPPATRMNSAASPTKRWAPSLQGIKFSDLFHGITLSTNFLFLLLFVGLFLWLFVIYWVRHHEPFANQVLGSPKSNASQVAADRALVGGIKKTFPVRTSEHSGEIYVPGSAPEPEPQPQAPAAHYLPAYGNPFSAQSRPVAAPIYPSSSGGSYMIGVHTGSGTKVKTIVSR